MVATCGLQQRLYVQKTEWKCVWKIFKISLTCWLSSKEFTCKCRRPTVRSLGQEAPLQKELATHSSILAWEIPRTEEPGELQSMGLQKHRTWLSSSTTTTKSYLVRITFIICRIFQEVPMSWAPLWVFSMLEKLSCIFCHTVASRSWECSLNFDTSVSPFAKQE